MASSAQPTVHVSTASLDLRDPPISVSRRPPLVCYCRPVADSAMAPVTARGSTVGLSPSTRLACLVAEFARIRAIRGVVDDPPEVLATSATSETCISPHWEAKQVHCRTVASLHGLRAPRGRMRDCSGKCIRLGSVGAAPADLAGRAPTLGPSLWRPFSLPWESRRLMGDCLGSGRR